MNQVNVPRQDLRMVEGVSDFQPLALRSTFWRPDYLHASPWLEHIPFAFWLVEAQQPNVLVELGTQSATSYFAFCQAVERLGLDTRCYAIGEWSGSQGEAAFARILGHNEAQYSSFSRALRCTPDEALSRFSNGSIDLLHVDAEEDALEPEEVEAWLPKMSKRGVVLLHRSASTAPGTGSSNCFDTLRRNRPHFEFLHGEGLAIIGVGSEQGYLLRKLFGATGNDVACKAIHEVFARLGRACFDHHDASTHRERAADLSEQVDKQQRQLEEVKQSLDKTRTDLNNRAKELAEAKTRLQTQLEQHAVERGQLSERVSLLQEIRAELKDEMARLKDQIETAQSELSRRTEEVKALAVEAGEHKAHIAIARTTLETRDAELTQSREALRRAKLDLAEAVTAQEKGAGELAIANATEAQRLAQVSELSARVQKAEAELERRAQDASQRDKAHRDQLAKLSAQSDSAQSELRERRYELQVANQRSTKLEGELQRLTELVAQAEQGLKDAELSRVAQTDALKANIEVLQAAQTGMQQSLHQAAQEAAAARESHGKLLVLVEQRDAQIKTLRDDLARQVEDNKCAAAALAKYQDMVREKEEALSLSHEAGARSLAEAHALRDRLAERDAELHSLREQAVRIARDFQEATQQAVAARESLREKEEALSLSHEEGARSLAEADALRDRLAERDAELHSLREQAVRIARDFQEATQQAVAARESLREKEEALSLSHEEGARSLAEANALRDRLAERDAELHGVREQAVRVAEEVGRLHADNSALQASLRQRFEETAKLTAMLVEQENANRAEQQRQKDQLAELQDASRASSEFRQAAAQREASLSTQIALLTEKNESYARDLDAARAALRTAADEATKSEAEHAALQARLKARDGELASCNVEIAKQADEISRHQEAIAQSKAALDASFAEIAKRTGMLTALEEQLSAQRERFDAAAADAESTRERLSVQLASARQQLAGQHDCVQALKQTASWRFTAPLRMVANAFRKSARLSPELQKDLKVLVSSGLFDERWYLQRYDDVKQTGMNALEHYLRFGAAEGRDPGPRFSTAAYLSAYPDVAKSGSNPLVHYVKHGLGEGRVATVAPQ